MNRFSNSVLFVMFVLNIGGCGAQPEGGAPGRLLANAPAAAPAERLTHLFERYWDEQIPRDEAIAPQALADALDVEKRYLAELLTVPRDQLDADAALSYDIFRQQRETAIEGFTYPSELTPLNPFTGMPVKLAAAAAQSAESWSPKQYERWLRGAEDYVRWTHQAIVNMREGVQRGYTAPRALVERMLTLLASLGAESESNVFYTPLRSMPGDMPAADRERLSTSVRETVSQKVLPATRALHDYLQHEYLDKARNGLALSELPLGAAWYNQRMRRAAGPGVIALEAHRLGLSEVDRLKARLQALAPAAAPSIAAAPAAPEISDALAAYEELGKQAESNLTALFGEQQPLPFQIRAVDFVPTPAPPIYYRGAMPSNDQAAVLFVNARELSAKPDVAYFAQEAIPGHHLQNVIQQQHVALPRFRRFAADPAFVAGWGLYAVRLAEEMGMYSGESDKYQAAKLQMRCAAALVIDTGLHSQGWTRVKALEYLHSQAGLQENEAQVMIDESAAMPGDALACALGAAKFQSLRAKTQELLGTRFDIREFHAQLLKDGAMPLNILDAKMNKWIKAER